MTASAFEALADELGAEGLTRHELRRARDEVVNEDTIHGPILKRLFVTTILGGVMPMLIACPFASLYMALQIDGSFQQHFAKCLRDNPPSYENPWNMARGVFPSCTYTSF